MTSEEKIRKNNRIKVFSIPLFAILLIFASSITTFSKQSKPANKALTKGFGVEGAIIPTDATTLVTPQLSISIDNLNLDHYWMELLELKEDGLSVRKGDIVARFKFPFDSVRKQFEDKLEEIKSERDKQLIDLEAKIEGLESQLSVHVLDAQAAKIETMKGKSISKIKLTQNQINYKIAQFQVDSLIKRTHLAKNALKTEKEYYEGLILHAEKNLNLFDKFSNSFVLLAPHDGTVRHVSYGREKRKLQQGDGLPCGEKVLFVAKNQKLSVKLFVPEHKIHRIKLGQTVSIILPSSEQPYPAITTDISYFPQQLSYLKEDNELPNGYEKAYTVIARFKNQPTGLVAGNEIKAHIK